MRQNLVHATGPGIISFQGKVVNADGTNVTNGSYNFDFVMYDDVTLGTPSDGVHDKWHELTKSVTVTNGVFQTNLGSATALPDFNANPSLYLAVRFNADAAGYMSPRIQMASVPYALNSDALNGKAASAFGQLAANETFTGTQTLQPTTNITSAIVKQTSFATPTADIFNIQTTNGTSVLQITGPAINEAAVTLNSVGATRDLTLDSASGTLKFGANTTTLQKSGTAFTFDLNNASNSTFTITNANGTGVASLSVEGNISTTATVFGNTIDRSTAGLLSIGTGGASATTSITIGSASVTSMTFTSDNNAANDFTFTGGVTASSVTASGNLVVQGTTGITFNTGAGGDITFANLEKIDNDTNGQINLSADSGALTLLLTGTSTTVQNSAGNLGITAASALNLTGVAASTWQTTGTSSNIIVRSGATTANTALTLDTNAVSGGSGGVTITTGSASAGASGGNNISTGSGTSSTGAVAINTGNASAGTAGSISLNVGTSTSGTGNINIGTVGSTAQASTVHIADTSGNAAQSVTVGGTGNTSDIVTLQGGGAASTIVLQTAASGGIDIGVNNVSSKTVNIGSVGSTAQTTVLHIADSTGAAQTVTLGSISTTSTTTIQSGSGNINLSPSAGSHVVFSQGAGSNLQLTASAVPTIDQLAISNAGQAVTSNGVNGLSINYVGGAAAVESAGERVDLTPGTTTGGTWSGLRIVANGTGAVSGVTEYGIKLEGPTANGVGTETGLYIGTGWDTGLNVQSGGLNLAGYTSGGNPADPAAPATDNLRVYAKKVAGRMLLKIKGPSGLDSPLQPALFGNNTIMYSPTSGTTVTGGFGTLWAKGSSLGTVNTPTPATTAPAITNQMHRTRQVNVATTTNQSMGIRTSSADSAQFWMGNSAGLGGFFFSTRFIVELWPAATVRIFAGLSSSATEVVASDTVAGDVVGLWHDTTDLASTLNLVTRNNTTTTKTAIALSNNLAAGNAYDWYMFVKPNDTTVYYRLDDITNGVSYEGNTTTTVPRSTIFMLPQVEMSNGTANTTVTTTGIGVARIYIESDH